MKAYQPYVEYLNGLVDSLLATASPSNPSSPDLEALGIALDGGALTALRQLVGLKDRRDSGAFFTSSALADLAWQPLNHSLSRKSVIVDPACGAGSLLIPGLRSLLKLTKVESACQQIRGRDLVESFVAASRARLSLTVAQERLALTGPQKVPAVLFPEVRPGNGLSEMNSLLDGATHIVLNPPYNPIAAPGNCDWAIGRINHAALFAHAAISCMPPGARIVGILPDVLRSGPRYTPWRAEIQKMAEINQIIPWGIFDQQTDVHVFVVHMTKLAKPSITNTSQVELGIRVHDYENRPENVVSPTVSRYFKISVGSVVPHRHAEVGPVRPFASARQLPAWEAVTEIRPTRRFSGRCESPPFVAIRRTSRPGQSPRARATIVGGKTQIAVDNHLIIAQPLDGSEQRCAQLLEVLRATATTDWLDSRYRCQHLPNEAIANLPWLVDGR